MLFQSSGRLCSIQVFTYAMIHKGSLTQGFVRWIEERAEHDRAWPTHGGKTNTPVIVLYLHVRNRSWVLITISKSWKELGEQACRPGLFQLLLLTTVGPCAPELPALGNPRFPSRHSMPSTWSLFLHVLTYIVSCPLRRLCSSPLRFA